ncbi:MAG: hypothetical protein ACC726_14340, partial [Chloroflexota bacterium]
IDATRSWISSQGSGERRGYEHSGGDPLARWLLPPSDDILIWEDVLIPASNAEHPDIDVRFRVYDPRDYVGAIRAALDAGTTGDLITSAAVDDRPSRRGRGAPYRMLGARGPDRGSPGGRSSEASGVEGAIACV